MRGLSMFSRFGAMPMGVQMALGAGSLGVMGLFYLAWFFWRSGGGWIIIIGVAILLVIVCFAIYRFFRKRKADKRGKEFTKEMSSLPGQGDKAQDASFSRAFEEGIEKYRQAGRRVMEQPWFLVIGEPSSGKTKAIKRSIRFDPLLTNRYQGSGGTQNMDWWFAQDAVIIDTAGKMAFPENAERVSSTWSELLRKLKKARPFAPINGVLLFISAESIQEKTVEQLQDEARVANTRLREINRDLGVRFPVWVIISKADKITGFREMLHELTAAEEQHQIFGWSNPVKISSAESDKPFDAKRVQEYVNEIAANVERLRMSVIQNPTPQAIAVDPDARRLDEVDELYQLPEALRRIGYRLQLYAEEAMSQGVSGTPLFMRGIYFTSAEQKGDVLDLLLAEQLDIPVSELRRPVGEEEDDPNRDYGSPYFLKDLFERKVFEESGLVTAQRSVGKAETRRRIWMMGGLAASALLVIGLGYWASGALKEMIELRSGFWHEVADRTPRTVTIGGGDSKGGIADQDRFRLVKKVDGGYSFEGGQTFAISHDESLGGAAQLGEQFEGAGALPPGNTYGFQIPLRTLQYATDFKKPKAGGIAWAFFWPARKLTGEVFESQKAAHLRVLVDGVLGPTILAAHERLGTTDPDFTGKEREAAIESLGELLKLEAGGTEPIKIEPLVRFVAFGGDDEVMGVAPGDVASPAQQVAALQIAIDATYSPESNLGARGKWPPDRVLDVRPGPDSITKGVAWFVGSQIKQSQDSKRGTGAWARLIKLQESLRLYQEAEVKLLGVSFNVETETAYAQALGEWREYWAQLEGAHQELGDAWDELVNAPSVDGGDDLLGEMSVNSAIELATMQVLRGPRDNYDRLLQIVSEMEEGSPTKTIDDKGELADLADASSELKSARAALVLGWQDFASKVDTGEGGSEWTVLQKHAGDYLRKPGDAMEGPSIGEARFKDRFLAMKTLAGVLGADDRVAPGDAVDPFGMVESVLSKTEEPLLDEDELDKIGAALAVGGKPEGAKTHAAQVGTAAARFQRFSVMSVALKALEESPSGADIGGLIGGRVDKAERVARTAIPLTGFEEGSHYLDRYNAGEAGVVIGAIDAMIDERARLNAGGTGLDPLDADTFDARIEPLGAARAAYLGEYFDYWSDTVPGEVVAGDFDWAAAREIVGNIVVRDVNRMMESEFDRCLGALGLGSLDDVGTDQEQKEVKDRRGEIQDAVNKYGDQDSPLKISDWTVLVPSGSQGADALLDALRLPPGAEGHKLLKREMFEPEGIEARDSYWSGMMLGLLELAATEGAHAIGGALEDLEANGEKKPFNLSGGQWLSFEQVRAMARDVQGVAARGDWSDDALGRLPSNTQESMKTLLGWGKLSDEDTETLQRFGKLLTVLVGDGDSEFEELRFELVLVGYGDVYGDPPERPSPLNNTQRDAYQHLLNEYLSMDVSVGEDRLEEVGRFDTRGKLGAVSELQEEPGSTGAIRIGFSNESTSDPDTWGELRGEWSLLMAIVRTNARVTIRDKSYRLARLNKVENPGARATGDGLPYYIGLRIVNDDGRDNGRGDGVRERALTELLKDRDEGDPWP